MSQEEEATARKSGVVSKVEGAAMPLSSLEDGDESKSEVALPSQMIRTLLEIAETRTSIGPDPETSRIIAETERHAEEKKLEGYKATLEHRDKENERKHIRQLKKIGNENKRAFVVLLAAIVAAITGVILSIDAKSNLGVPLLVFAGILIKDLTGKSSPSSDE